MSKAKTYFNPILLAFFIIYLLATTWIILFKMCTPATLYEIINTRSINLTPFRGFRYGYFNKTEFFGNIFIFIPFGIYISVYIKKLPFYGKILLAIALSLCYETLQYILAIGRSDITDIILNGFGGFIGLLLYQTAFKLIKNIEKTHKIIAVCSIATGIPSVLLLMLLVTSN